MWLSLYQLLLSLVIHARMPRVVIIMFERLGSTSVELKLEFNLW